MNNKDRQKYALISSEESLSRSEYGP